MYKDIDEAIRVHREARYVYDKCITEKDDIDKGYIEKHEQYIAWLEELKAYKEKELKHIHDILPPVPTCKLFDIEKIYRDEHDKQVRADERNNVLSTLKKLIDSDYKSKDCQLLFADLCEMLVEQLKESKE